MFIFYTRLFVLNDRYAYNIVRQSPRGTISIEDGEISILKERASTRPKGDDFVQTGGWPV